MILLFYKDIFYNYSKIYIKKLIEKKIYKHTYLKQNNNNKKYTNRLL